MQVDVKIDAETVNKMVTDAIMQSVIGEQLAQSVRKKIDELGRSYDNPIEKAVDREVQLIINGMVNDRFKPAIEAKVAEFLTEEMMSKIASAAWGNLIEQLQKLRHY